MATLLAKPDAYSICHKKCGQILMSTDAKQFELVCAFCSKIFKDLLEFKLHIRCCYHKATTCGQYDEQERVSVKEQGVNDEITKRCPEQEAKEEVIESPVAADIELGATTQDVNETSTEIIDKIDLEAALRMNKLQAGEILSSDPLAIQNEPLSADEICRGAEEVSHLSMPKPEGTRKPTTTLPKKPQATSTLSMAHCNYLIDEFERHEVLWNHKHAQYLNKFEHNLAYANITKSMNKKFSNLRFTKNIIMRRIERLKLMHRQMYTGKIGKLWCCEKLNFLNITNEQELKAIKNIEWTAQQNVIYAMDELLEQTSDEMYTKIADMLHDLKYTDCDSMSEFSDLEGFAEDETLENESVEQDQNASCSQTFVKTELDDDLQQEHLASEGINSHEVTLALIELYKMQPALWNRNHINYFRNAEHIRLYKTIAATLNEHFALKLNLTDVRMRIKQILNVYHHDFINCIYAKHLIFLTNYKPTKFICQYCNYNFVRRSKLVLHVQRMHKKRKRFQCDKCDRSFAISTQLKTHQVVHMSKQELRYLCEECGDNFRSLQTFRSHKSKVHNAIWDFVCEICKSGFARSTQLKTHTRVHTGEKPYLCQECGRSYKSLGQFIEHRDRHEKRQRYSCNICDKKFYKGSKLKIHMKKHSNTRDFVCEICGKSFIERKTLHIHMEIHSNQRNYECSYCGKSFKQRSGCYNHMQKQHQVST